MLSLLPKIIFFVVAGAGVEPALACVCGNLLPVVPVDAAVLAGAGGAGTGTVVADACAATVATGAA